MWYPWYQEGTSVLDSSTESISQWSNGLHDICSWNIQTFPLESQYSVYSETLKKQYLSNIICEATCINKSGNHVVSYGYLINELQGHPVYRLDSMAACCSSFSMTSLPFCEFLKVFQRFLYRKFEDPFERFFRLGHIYLTLVLFWMSDLAWKTNFCCHILIDRLITNPIALLVPVREQTEVGKMFGIDCRQFLSFPTPPPSCSPPPLFSPILLLTPGVLIYPPAFSLACSISAWKSKLNGCYAG